jgi:hypothetical protein
MSPEKISVYIYTPATKKRPTTRLGDFEHSLLQSWIFVEKEN